MTTRPLPSILRTSGRWLLILTGLFAVGPAPAQELSLERKAVVYLFNRLAQTFCPTPDHKLLLVWPGLCVPEIKGKPSVDDYATLSQIINVVPQDDLTYKPSITKAPDLIQYILDNKRTANVSLTPVEEAKLTKAFDYLHDPKTGDETTVYKKYLEQHALYDQVLDDLANKTFLAKVNNTYSAEQSKLQAMEQAALTAFKRDGYYSEVHEQFKIIDDLSNRDKKVWWLNFRNQFALQKSRASSGAFFPHTEYIPDLDHWLGEERWTPISFDAGSLADLKVKDLPIPPNQVPAVPLITLGGIEARVLPDFIISLDVKRVLIERPWLDRELFHSRAWKIDGVTPPPGGLTIHKGGKPDMPLLITGILLAKNITLRLQGFASLEEAEKSRRYSSFGPVTLQGNLLFGRGPANAIFRWGSGAKEGKQIFYSYVTYPGEEIIGFICDQVPKSPDPDPKYTYP